MTSFTSGRGHVILGLSDGRIVFVNRHLRPSEVTAFQRSVDLVFQLKQSGLLLLVGRDAAGEGGNNATLKVLDLDKPDKHGNPSLIRSGTKKGN